MHSLLDQIWTKEWLVFVLHKDGNHFTSPLVHYHIAPEHGCIGLRGELRYIDYFHDGDDWVLERITAFLDWNLQNSTVSHLADNWRK